MSLLVLKDKIKEQSVKVEELAKEIGQLRELLELPLIPLQEKTVEEEALVKEAFFVEGDIVGVDDTGRLTKRYSESIHFVIMAGRQNAAMPKEKVHLRTPAGGKFFITPQPGDYIVAICTIDGSDGIVGVPVSKAVMTFPDFANSVGRVVSRPVMKPDKSFECVVEPV